MDNLGIRADILRVRKSVRDADFVSLHSLYSFPALAGYLLARIYWQADCLWPHGVLAPFQRRVSAARKWIYDRIIARRILNDASVLFYSSRGEREEVAPLGLTVAFSWSVPHGIYVSEFLVPTPKGRFRARYLSGHKGPLIVFSPLA